MGEDEVLAEPAETSTDADRAEPALLTRRWSRAGRDFLYLTLEDGTEVGRADLVSGELHCEVPALAQRARTTVERWKQDHGDPAAAGPDAAGDDPAHDEAAGHVDRVTVESLPAAPAPAEREDPGGSEDPVDAHAGGPDADSGAGDVGAAPGALAAARAVEARRRGGRAWGWLLDARTGERTQREAARGEQLVARQLATLPDGWHVLHSLPRGDDDVDHLVVGPGGVFSLTTRNHGGARLVVTSLAVVVEGRETTHLADAREVALHVTGRLSAALGEDVPVHPVLVVLARQLKVKRHPDDVAVVGRRGVADWLRSRPDQLGADEVESIAQLARQRSTWV